MAGWLEWLTGQKNRSAGQAKERLKLVLINDRTDLSPEELEINEKRASSSDFPLY